MVSGNTKKMCCSCEEVAEESPPFNPESDESPPVNSSYRSAMAGRGDSENAMGSVWVWVAIAAILVAIAALVFYAYNQKKFHEF